ncbi:MAG: hypothetical protein MI924_23225 [Chloroflexales bacterium]|nr:hypothetical protein [Chloroflexales bacterium]
MSTTPWLGVLHRPTVRFKPRPQAKPRSGIPIATPNQKSSSDQNDEPAVRTWAGPNNPKPMVK